VRRHARHSGPPAAGPVPSRPCTITVRRTPANTNRGRLLDGPMVEQGPLRMIGMLYRGFGARISVGMQALEHPAAKSRFRGTLPVEGMPGKTGAEG